MAISRKKSWNCRQKEKRVSPDGTQSSSLKAYASVTPTYEREQAHTHSLPLHLCRLNLQGACKIYLAFLLPCYSPLPILPVCAVSFHYVVLSLYYCFSKKIPRCDSAFIK